MIKIYECKICDKFVKKGLKDRKRFIGSRESVRKHLVEVHGIKGRKNTMRVGKKDFGQSDITQNMIVRRWGT